MEHKLTYEDDHEADCAGLLCLRYIQKTTTYEYLIVLYC